MISDKWPVFAALYKIKMVCEWFALRWINNERIMDELCQLLVCINHNVLWISDDPLFAKH